LFIHLDTDAGFVSRRDVTLGDDLSFLHKASPEWEFVDPMPLTDQEVRD
jgi:hypothetical protein